MHILCVCVYICIHILYVYYIYAYIYSTSTGVVQRMIKKKKQVYISFVLFYKHWNGPKAEASVSAL